MSGAIRATMAAHEGRMNAKGTFIHNLVERIPPTVLEAKAAGFHEIDEITALHIKDTIQEMITRSSLIQSRIESGKLAVVGANYALSLGEVHPLQVVGNID